VRAGPPVLVEGARDVAVAARGAAKKIGDVDARLDREQWVVAVLAG
jgi:hypothetical protein